MHHLNNNINCSDCPDGRPKRIHHIIPVTESLYTKVQCSGPRYHEKGHLATYCRDRATAELQRRDYIDNKCDHCDAS